MRKRKLGKGAGSPGSAALLTAEKLRRGGWRLLRHECGTGPRQQVELVVYDVKDVAKDELFDSLGKE